MDRERAFYPAVVIAVASYLAIAAVFITPAVAGFRYNPWIAVFALAGHGVMDGFHHHVVHNTGVPQVWPGFCMIFDVTAAALVARIMVVRGDGRRKLCQLAPLNHVFRIRGAVLSTSGTSDGSRLALHSGGSERPLSSPPGKQSHSDQRSFRWQSFHR
jgi:hypothetical protein